jgi:hypothetical protein
MKGKRVRICLLSIFCSEQSNRNFIKNLKIKMFESIKFTYEHEKNN